MAMPEDVSALHLVLTGDSALFAIVRLSLVISLSAVMFGALIGVPFGALIALIRFRGRAPRLRPSAPCGDAHLSTTKVV
jgi:tungstate transport system permease protein